MSRFRINLLAALFLLGATGARAETDVWLDGFETNAGTNWTTNTVWKVGSPTTSLGPPLNAAGFRAYSGSRCATTGLTGNAPGNVDGRLICTNYNGQPYLAIPDASLFPRLRFWQWFDFANSLGYVEARQQSGTNWLGWQAISTINESVGGTTSIGGGWTRQSLDLTAFAGTNIQIAFHFSSGSGGFGNDPGWYVDNVALVTGPPTMGNPENFEGGLGDWYADNGIWQVGTPATGPKGAFSGTNCAGTALSGNYPQNADSRLISPPFTVPPSNSPALNFWQWYQFDNAAAFVEVSSALVSTNFTYTTNFLTATNINFDTNITTVTNFVDEPYYQTNLDTDTNVNTDTFIYGVTNSGVISLQTNILTFTNVNTGTDVFFVNGDFTGTYLQTNIDIFTNFNQFPAYITTNAALATNAWQSISPTILSSGSAGVTSSGWVPASLDLSAFAGQTLRVAFHFTSGINVFGSGPGWFIDNVSVVTTPVLTVPSDQAIVAGQTFSATATATNASAPTLVYTFSFAAPTTNAFITTNGVINWTNKSPVLGANLLSVVVSDTNSPPVRLTNSFNVDVSPGYSFSVTNSRAGRKFFILALHSRTNLTWEIDASTDLFDWQPVWTNSTKTSGTLLFTDLLATNFPQRFYRAVYP